MNVREKYVRLRKNGALAAHALHMAKTWQRWEGMEDAGLVRLTAEPEQGRYFDVYGEPDGYTNQYGREVSAEEERKELCELLERWGCWHVRAEYRTDPDSEEWEPGDSVGMCVYENPLSPLENWYVPDLMNETLEQLENATAVCPD
jgi:hypothetical protein